MMAQLVFYIFTAVLLFSACMVITARNPVHSVLFLILTFFNASGLFLVAGAEFLAMLLVIVYVGAVAVLFLFVVMMLDVDFGQLREGFQKYAPLGGCVGGILFAELVLAFSHWEMAPSRAAPIAAPELTNTAALGGLIYTHYVLLFQACGLVLLVAMIGAITLTLREKATGRRQNITRQHARTRADTLEMLELDLGESVADRGGFLRPKSSYNEIAVPGSFGLVPETPTNEVASNKEKGA
ncbi:NADH-quinone oxidoreductase subunit J [Acetobacter suratthaniensis]|uniref:NADH-quinone oxidoreductase subunit J n=1 Tax=Acetobacter suratthaniensis TaxID=1502841 RepID=A0ABS3LIZ6_9PROT|nr:NADH-quinone oxidoreductase subunit J [Acetobacter suratthaniensis]MBO1327578.1 NADH-quinone oxidoreductase subunit J [Acetobacter suratthaniensis]MCX2565560.1 NADH-quinone oxidoreductase subunit J [Acetobacter suratthaniensis]